MDNQEKEFESFKAAAQSKGWNIDGETTQNGYVFYDGLTSARWVGWQAAKADPINQPNQISISFDRFEELINKAMNAVSKTEVAVPAGFVLVEKSQIKTWYQDDNEPENYCYEADSFDVLGDCLDHEDIIQVNKIEDTIIQTTPMFGVWKFKIIGGQVERDRFVLCQSEVEANAIRDEYRRMVGLKAQEQGND